MEPDDYQAWLSGGGVGRSMSARGEQLFQQLACNTCHVTDGTGRGPSLAGVFGSQVTLDERQTVVADESYIRESILTPQAKLVAGLSAADADVPGARQRRRRDEPHRVREVAAGTTGGPAAARRGARAGQGER